MTSSYGRSEKSTGPGPGNLKRKPTKTTNDKKINDDEFMAAAIGDVEWLRQSLRASRGAVNFDKNGLAPIHLASIHGRLDCLRLIVEKFKVDVNLGSSTGWRPTHLCISNQTGKRSFQCLNYLLERGADPSMANEDGITPMHQAASEGHVQCLKALIEVGAMLDGEDCRGHKPIDLAKLWGHRKCARILAAEQWHQDKDFLSKEMKHLQKLKMKQVLEEIQADEEHKSEQQFYGDAAFKEWLDNRKLKPGSTGPNGRSRPRSTDNVPKSASKTKGEPSNVHKTPEKESLYKANSVQRDSQPAHAGAAGARPMAAGHRAYPPARDGDHRPDTFPSPGPERQTQVRFPERHTEVVAGRGGSGTTPPVISKESTGVYDGPRPAVPASTANDNYIDFYNENDWNKSTKVMPKSYVTVLTDHYPRDEYTMLPKNPPNRAAREPSALEEVEKEVPHVPRDVVAKTMNPQLYDRPVVYKCKHIADIHKKHHPPYVNLPKSEAGIHLTNDPSSRLFKEALLAQEQPRYRLGTPASALSGVSSWSGSNLSLRSGRSNLSLANIMQRMSKPGHYPHISGSEYDLNLGQVAI